MLFVIASLVLVTTALMWLAARTGRSANPGTAQLLGVVAAIVGFGVALFVGATAAATVGDPFHRSSETAWLASVAVAAAVGATALLVGCLRWSGAAARSLRLVGFVGLLFATLGSRSWVLPLLAPLVLLALPSVVTRPPHRGAALDRA